MTSYEDHDRAKLDAIVAAAEHHPTYERLMRLQARHREPDGSFRPRANRDCQPWEAMAIRLFMLAVSARMQRAALDAGDAAGTMDARQILTMLVASDVYLVTTRILKTIEAVKVPPHVIERGTLPARPMFVVWADARPRPEGGAWSNWSLLDEDDAGLRIMAQHVPTASADVRDVELPDLRGYAFGQRWPDDYTDDLYERQPAEFVAFAKPAEVEEVLRLCAFLRSKAVVDDPVRPPRRMRSKAEPDPLDLLGNREDVRVVRLRHAALNRRKLRNKDGEVIHWRGYWSRVGHIRNQWYPSERVHRPIWIDQTFAGNFDGPFMPKTYSVER